MSAGHGGDIYRDEGIRLDFSISVNPMGLPAAAALAAREAVSRADRYPDPSCRALRAALGAEYGLPASRFFCGNGAAELIFRLVRAIRPRTACLPVPGFSEYERALEAEGCRIQYVEMKEETGFCLPQEEFWQAAQEADLVFLCNPANPTGRLEDLEDLAVKLLKRGVWLAVDECFLGLTSQEAAEGHSLRRLLSSYDRLCILDGLTKSRAMAGLRLGYVISGNDWLLGELERQGQPWGVSVIAQEAGAAALRDREYMRRSLERIERERRRAAEALTALGFTVYPSSANFILFRDDREEELWQELRARGILIRNCGNFRGLDGSYYRIGLKTEGENQTLLEQIKEILTKRRRKR